MRSGNTLLKPWQLTEHLERPVLPTQLDSIDQILGGFPRGAITEITGAVSSGRTSLLHTFLAAAISQGEYCAIVDTSDTFDPASAEAAGITLSHLFWVRCGKNAEHALRCADLLIHGGGWGVIVLDFADIPPAVLRRIPTSYWYRFKRAIEPTPAVLVVIEREPYVKACASLALEMSPMKAEWRGTHPHLRLLDCARIAATSRKPVRPQPAKFVVKAIA